ncbi:hypothetical protein [Novosphingobium marinum]|nr:hypothetical protein [Novosphingobium marinum]
MARNPPSRNDKRARADRKKTSRNCSQDRPSDSTSIIPEMELKMVSKVERERAALEAAEQDIAERKKRLAQMEKEEAGKELARLVRKVGHERSVRLLELAVSVKPKSAIEALEKMEPAGQKQAS